MISLHRLSKKDAFLLNPDHILAVDANPDTVVTMTNGAHYVVAETPQEVAQQVRAWRASIALAVLDPGADTARPRLAAVVAGPGLASTAAQIEPDRNR
jgi:flagellar protein FlbD